MYKYNKLKGRIVEKLGGTNLYAERLGISRITLYLKLQGKSDFTQDEIHKSMDILEIKPEEIHLYFFQIEN